MWYFIGVGLLCVLIGLAESYQMPISAVAFLSFIIGVFCMTVDTIRYLNKRL